MRHETDERRPAVGSSGPGKGHGSLGGRPFEQHVSTRSAGRQELVAASGKVAAAVMGRELVKRVDGSRHFLRRPAAIAFDEAILTDAARLGACEAVVTDRETGNVYRAPLGSFWEHGVKVNRGFGAQLALPFAFWTCERPGAPRQLSLFA